MPPDFGFEIAPEIAAAEREAVSTDPGSSLQGAIRSTQASTEFFNPGQLLQGGPKAFDIAAVAEERRRNMLVQRAQQGIGLSGAAIAQRGVQTKADARKAMEVQAAEFMNRTRGMDFGQTLGELTPGDAANNLIMDEIVRPRDVLDSTSFAVEERGIQRVEQRIRKESLDPELEIKRNKAKIHKDLLEIQESARALSSMDISRPYNVAKMANVSSEQAVKISEISSGEGADALRNNLSDLEDMIGVHNQVASRDSSVDSEAVRDLSSSILASIIENGGGIDKSISAKMGASYRESIKRLNSLEAEEAETARGRARAYQALAEMKSAVDAGATDEELVKKKQALVTLIGGYKRIATQKEVKTFGEAMPGYHSLKPKKRIDERRAWLAGNPSFVVDIEEETFTKETRDENADKEIERLMTVLSAINVPDEDTPTAPAAPVAPPQPKDSSINRDKLNKVIKDAQDGDPEQIEVDPSSSISDFILEEVAELNAK